MTATIWDADETSKGLPTCGQMVTVVRFTKPKLFRGECCQFTTRLQDLQCKDMSKPAAPTLTMKSTGETVAHENPSSDDGLPNESQRSQEKSRATAACCYIR